MAEINEQYDEQIEQGFENPKVKQIDTDKLTEAFVPVFDTITFKSGVKKQELFMFSPYENNGRYLLGIDILLNDKNKDKANDGEALDPTVDDCSVIFSSKPMVPEEEMETLMIPNKLKRGNYDGFVRYRFYSPDNDVVPLATHIEPTEFHVKQNLTALWIALAALLLAGCIGAMLWFYNDYNSKKHVETGGIQYSLNSEEPSAPSAGIQIPMWSGLTIDANQQDVRLEVYNPKGNKDICYLEFTLTLTDTNEEIFQSNLIKPGETIPKATLKRPLPAGNYNAYLSIKPYDIETLEPIGRNGGNNMILHVR